MALLDTNYNPGVMNSSAVYDIEKLDTTGATSGQAPLYNGTTVAWGTPAVAPGAITLTDAHILVGNGTNDATDVAVSGDLTLVNTGAFTIANSAITNAKVDAAAAIDFSKLATLTSGNILVGSAGNVATSVAMSGDVTIIASGATTVDAVNLETAALYNIADTEILIGNGAASATFKSITGDAALANTGVLTVTDLTITGETAGDILYFNGSNWVKLSIGTAGQVLTVNAGATAPEWQTP